MSRLIETIKSIARYELSRRPICELGIATSVFAGDDTDAPSVSVVLKDSGLAIPRVPITAPLSGEVALPRVGDMMLVFFPRGDLSSAVIAGIVHSEQRRPPEVGRDEIALEWPSGTSVPDAQTVRVKTSGGESPRKFEINLSGDLDATFTLSDGTVEMAAGGVKLRMSHGSASDGTVEVSAGETHIRIAQDGDVEVQAAGTLTLRGQTVAISGDTSVTVNGQSVEIN